MPINTAEFLKTSGILLVVAVSLFSVSAVIGIMANAPEIGFIVGSIVAYLSMIYTVGYLSKGIEESYMREIEKRVSSSGG